MYINICDISFYPLASMPTCRVMFGHVMSKAAQYIIDNIKFCVGFLEVSLKEVQSSLQKIIT